MYRCLETEYGVSQEDVILYGQSVGSGPTLHLASKLPRLRGVVLHSAILSGLRVLCHVKFTFCCDIYKVEKIWMVHMMLSTLENVKHSTLLRMAEEWNDFSVKICRTSTKSGR